MTAWVFVAMLYAADGSRHYRLGETYATSDKCFPIAEAATKQLMAARMGWAMCLPKDQAAGLQTR